MPRQTRFPVGMRVHGNYAKPRVGTVVGRCNMGVHVQWDGRTYVRPRTYYGLDRTGDTHDEWGGLIGASTENRTWFCVERKRIVPD